MLPVSLSKLLLVNGFSFQDEVRSQDTVFVIAGVGGRSVPSSLH